MLTIFQPDTLDSSFFIYLLTDFVLCKKNCFLSCYLELLRNQMPLSWNSQAKLISPRPNAIEAIVRKNIETVFTGQIRMEDMNKEIALRRGAPSLERRILAGTAWLISEGIISEERSLPQMVICQLRKGQQRSEDK